MGRSQTKWHSAGFAFESHKRFGSFPMTALFEVLADSLPLGSIIKFINPFAQLLETFLKAEGHKSQSSFLTAGEWIVTHDGPAGRVHRLANTVREHNITSITVWFEIYGPSGSPLLEVEDGNTSWWVAASLPVDTREKIMTAVGIQGGAIPSASLN